MSWETMLSIFIPIFLALLMILIHWLYRRSRTTMAKKGLTYGFYVCMLTACTLLFFASVSRLIRVLKIVGEVTTVYDVLSRAEVLLLLIAIIILIIGTISVIAEESKNRKTKGNNLYQVSK